MEELFSGNIIVLYFAVCISIYNFDCFNEQLKITLIYAITYVGSYLDLFSTKIILVSLIIILFFLTEYFTNETYTPIIFKKLYFKIYDFLYMIFFHYDFSLIFIALLFQSTLTKEYITPQICNLISVTAFFVSIHHINTHTFRIHNITTLMDIFYKDFPIYKLPSDVTPELFKVLIAIEDKSYIYKTQ